MSTLQNGSQATTSSSGPTSVSSTSSSSGGGSLFLALLIALALLGYGGYVLSRSHSFTMLAAGAASLVIVLIAWPILSSRRSSTDMIGIGTTVLDAHLAQRLDQIESMLRTISEQQLLSDRAKAVAFREKDREALRKAIREDMGRKDWDAALVLANSMEREFGYASEAALLRAEIRRNQADAIQRQITQTVSVIEAHAKAEQWTSAVREADRLQQIYPDVEQVKRLPQDIEAMRQAHKKQLYESWNEAVARKDVDGSIEVLKRLDPYLTPAEATTMQETARSVFKEKINILKNQYSDLALTKPAEAVRVGETIIRDFPNSRLAMEVRETIDTLRQRASGKAEVARA